MPCCPRCGHDRISGVDDFGADRIGASHAADPDTSRDAALLNLPRSGSQRERVLLKLVEFGSAGATFEQLVTAAGIESAAKRLTELVQGNWAIQTTHTRKTHTGANATVHIASDRAYRELERARSAHQTAGGGASSPSSTDQAVRDQGTPSARSVAAPPALTHPEPTPLFGDEPQPVGSTSPYDVEAA